MWVSPAGDALDRATRSNMHSSAQRAATGVEAGGLRRFVHDHAAAGLGDRFGDRGEVQRFERGDVDDFRADAVGGQFLGGFQGFP